MSAPVWLVTGAGSGVGRTLAVAIASTGAEVILASRRREKLEDTARWCWAPSLVAPVDLADPSSVEALAGTVRGYLDGRPLGGIVHAAGRMAWSSDGTSSGWSEIPLVNAVSPWRLTLALEDALVQGPPGRVLLVAGAPFTLQGVRPDVSRWKGNRGGHGLALATEAAAAKVILARVLHRRWSGRAFAFAFHPGLVKSNLADGLPFPLNFFGCVAQPFLAGRSATGEYLALDPGAPTLSGQLVSGRRGFPNCPFPSEPTTEDEWVAELLT